LIDIGENNTFQLKVYFSIKTAGSTVLSDCGR